MTDDNNQASKKARSLKPFIIITLVLTITAIAAYYGLAMYQKRLQKKSKDLIANQTILIPIEKAIIEPDSEKKASNEDKGSMLKDELLGVKGGKKERTEEIPESTETSKSDNKHPTDKPEPTKGNEKLSFIKNEWDKKGWLAMMEDIRDGDSIFQKNTDIFASQGRISEPQNDTIKKTRWIEDGWTAKNTNGIDAALTVWKKGFFSLSKTKIIMVIDVSENQNRAMSLLQRLGKEHYVFVIEEENDPKGLFCVISIPPLEDLWKEQGQIVKKLDPGKHTKLPAIFLKGNFKEKVVALMHENNTTIVSKPAPLLKTKTDTKEPSIKNVKKKEEALNMEEQLDSIKHLIHIGSYVKAINILNPIIKKDVSTWQLYLFMGTAYLGLGNLDSAEMYLDKGLAINGKQPQLWLQRAIVEQQRNNHESAIEILKEAEKIAPTMPEIQLNIGYSNDAIGNRTFETRKAYRYFIQLTEGNPAYLITRQKVLRRLASFQ